MRVVPTEQLVAVTVGPQVVSGGRECDPAGPLELGVVTFSKVYPGVTLAPS